MHGWLSPPSASVEFEEEYKNDEDKNLGVRIMHVNYVWTAR